MGYHNRCFGQNTNTGSDMFVYSSSACARSSRLNNQMCCSQQGPPEQESPFPSRNDCDYNGCYVLFEFGSCASAYLSFFYSQMSRVCTPPIRLFPPYAGVRSFQCFVHAICFCHMRSRTAVLEPITRYKQQVRT